MAKSLTELLESKGLVIVPDELTEREQALKEITDAVLTYGLTFKELGLRKPRAKKAKKAKPKIERPQCNVPGCNNLAVNTKPKTHHLYPYWRRSNWIKEKYPEATDIYCCSKCHNDNTANKHGVDSARHLTAARLGLTVTEYQHQFHAYLWNRKDYCENSDGRLGFVCTTNLFWPGMLDVDHIDGNHLNNDPDNHQTLCKCCHAYKTWKNGDAKTPGRKTRVAA